MSLKEEGAIVGVEDARREGMAGEVAVEEIRVELERIPDGDVRRLSVQTPHAVSIGFAYARAFEEDRARFEATFTKKALDVEELGNMEVRARAFWHLDILKRQFEDPAGPVKELLVAAVPLRSRLLKAAFYIWGDHPVLGGVVDGIRAGNGHMNKADDLGSLATLFHEHWDEAAGKCNVSKSDIAEAQKLGAAILQAKSPIRLRELDELRGLRLRAGEYLRRGIETIRAGAGFIHRDDPEAMGRYPSLFAKSRRRKTVKNGTDAATESQTSPPHVLTTANSNLQAEEA